MFRTYHQENNPIMAYDSSDGDSNSYYDYDKDNYEDISDDDDWMEEYTGGGGGGGGSAKDKVKCECRQCKLIELGKNMPFPCAVVNTPHEYIERRRNIEMKQLADYTERNGHLAAADPQRHACGNGAVESRRHCILTHKGFTVHVPNPSAPMTYLLADGGIAYLGGIPLEPGEVRNDDNFRDSFRTPEGMTVQDYRRLIDDYHKHEQMIDTSFAAFPRHHALAMASLSSTCATLGSGLWATKKTGLGLGDRVLDAMSIPTHIRTYSTAHFKRAFGTAKQHAQNPTEITRFTEMSGMQRNTVLAHSGIAGLLISRLFSPPFVPTNQYKQTHMECVKQSRIVARRVHSQEECEIFADNRYGKAGKYNGNLVRMLDGTISKLIPDYDTLTLETARAELRVLYAREIHNLLGMIRRMKRGLSNVDEIRAMPVYRRMYTLWIYCLKEMMALYSNRDGTFSNVKHLVDIMGVSAEFPLMYSSEMLALYSKSCAKLMKAAIIAIRRLSSNASSDDNPRLAVGCRAGILTFAAVEPRMVDQYLAPRLAICSFDGNDKEDALENHVPSRCPIFGELRKKFQVHMPRTGDSEWDICRKNGGIIRSSYKY